MKVLILAGGRGTRLWPLSRRHKPKQFQKLLSDKTMLQETVDRLSPKISLADVFISTNKEYVREVRKEFPKLPRENIIAEPVSRERLAAVALFMSKLKDKDLQQPILVLPSDHLVKKKKEFQNSLALAEKFVRQNPQYIVSLGAKPTFPDTGLGYIKKGRILDKAGVYEVSFFKEKPNLKRARSYLTSPDYLWNMAVYIFLPVLLEEQMKKFVPDNYERYLKIREASGKSKVLAVEYDKMDSVGLEYSIIENYQKVAVIPTDIGWSDVGSWTVLKDCLATENNGFVKGNYIDIDSKNVMVYGSSNKLVAGIGISDLVIAITDDIVLICHKDHSQKVKEVIKKLEKQKKFDYI
ncbi:MAG: sugar phosphate nucleotidyltransferase [bacterium]